MYHLIIIITNHFINYSLKSKNAFMNKFVKITNLQLIIRLTFPSLLEFKKKLFSSNLKYNLSNFYHDYIKWFSIINPRILQLVFHRKINLLNFVSQNFFASVNIAFSILHSNDKAISLRSICFYSIYYSYSEILFFGYFDYY